MKDEHKILEGDLVDVHFENLTSIFAARVMGTPCDVGDSWKLVIEDGLSDGKVIYVQHFSLMERRNSAAERTSQF